MGDDYFDCGKRIMSIYTFDQSLQILHFKYLVLLYVIYTSIKLF